MLRPFREEDVALVLDAGQDALIPLITTVPSRGDVGQARAWIERQHQQLRDGLGYSFCVAGSDTDQPLGQIGLWPHRPDPGRASIGYWIGREHRWAGVATRAWRAISSWGLNHLGMERLELYVEPWNEGSWRAAESVGFQREGLMRRWEAIGDRRRDMFMYSLLPDDPRP